MEVGLSLNQHEYLVQQPLVSCNDETDAIKLSDLHDNAKRVDDESISAIDIVEIVEESDSGSEYEEVDEEAEEEVIEILISEWQHTYKTNLKQRKSKKAAQCGIKMLA